MEITGLTAKGFNQIGKCRYGTMTFNANDRLVGESLAHYGEWAEQELDLLSRVVQSGHTVLEVGGNLGAQTLWFAKTVGAEGAVHVAEAQRLDFQQLCANTALNGLTNVHAYPVCLGREPGTTRLQMYDPAQPYRYGRNLSGNAQKEESVTTYTIDTFKLDALHLIKVNGPTDPVAVLSGAVDTIKRTRPALYFGVGGLERARDEINFVRELGYQCWSHLAYLHNPTNYNDSEQNLFPGIVLQNVIATPVERSMQFDDLVKVS